MHLFELNVLTLKTSHTDENGKTATPTIKSATASDAMKMLVTASWSLEEQRTAAITRQLPTTTMMSIIRRMLSFSKAAASNQTTFSSKAAHAVSFSVFRITLANCLFTYNAFHWSLSKSTFKTLDPLTATGKSNTIIQPIMLGLSEKKIYCLKFATLHQLLFALWNHFPMHRCITYIHDNRETKPNFDFLKNPIQWHYRILSPNN